MGFPPKMFTVLFAIGRLPGWIAQWREMIEDPDLKISRPRQLYVGPPSASTFTSADADGQPAKAGFAQFRPLRSSILRLRTGLN